MPMIKSSSEATLDRMGSAAARLAGMTEESKGQIRRTRSHEHLELLVGARGRPVAIPSLEEDHELAESFCFNFQTTLKVLYTKLHNRMYLVYSDPLHLGIVALAVFAGIFLLATKTGNHIAREVIVEVLKPMIVPYVDIPHIVESHFTASVIGGVFMFLTLFLGRRYILWALLSWNGWMYSQKGVWFKMWALSVKLLSGSKQKLSFFQGSLPCLPVPPLAQTVEKYLISVRGVLNDEEYAKHEELAENFLKNEGPKLQRYLQLRSWFATNWLESWWERYVYLRGRSSLMINSNWYCTDACNVPTNRQTARAANYVNNILKVRESIITERLEPIKLQKLIPLCMSGYPRIFGTTRVPGIEEDVMVTHKSQHIIVLCRGKYYTIRPFHRDGSILTAVELEQQFEYIVENAQTTTTVCPGEEMLAAMTAESREVWAEARNTFFKEGLNKKSLEAVERAMFMVVLDDSEPTKLSRHGASLLHGDGSNRWFDKSFNLVVFRNGKTGINVEHTYADAPVVAHMWESSFLAEMHGRGYDDDGYNRRETRGKRGSRKPPAHPPKRVLWEFNKEAKSSFARALVNAQKQISDLDLKIYIHSNYGKGFIKTCKVSPDAFIQLALQRTFYRNQGFIPLTYESSMTRLFAKGRTETIRSVTPQSVAFVKSLDDESMSKEDKRKLLKAATAVHTNNTKAAMVGHGIDRHLFGLYVVSVGLNMPAPELLKAALKMPWTLSTSQTPANQTGLWDANSELYRNNASAGGGFGPVVEAGYGISYIIYGDHKIYFHISSNKRTKETNSRTFARHLEESFEELRELHE